MKKIISCFCLFVFLIVGCNDSNTPRSSDGAYKIICIDGHQYYYRSSGYGKMLTIKLDDDGRPVKCN